VDLAWRTHVANDNRESIVTFAPNFADQADAPFRGGQAWNDLLPRVTPSTRLHEMIVPRITLLIALAAGPLVGCNTVDSASLNTSGEATTGSYVALASAPDPSVSGRKPAERVGGGYFVEFRSRYAASYGHTFLVHGRLNANGEVGQLAPDQVAGLHPATESPTPWMIGHVVPVPSETGPSDGDLEEQYVSARFRVMLSEPEYRTVVAHIRERQKNSPLWHAVLYNCNAWVGDIARFMGLKAPADT
jgi:hypothetical protein